jgi:chromosomal replication initiation ATPase DnaA
MTDRQGLLDLALPARMGRAEFVPSRCNAQALAHLGMPLPDGRLVLHGPEGSGKTHLAHIWATANNAAYRDAPDLMQADIPALVGAGAVALDRADMAGGDPALQTALFHLLNLARAQGVPVLLAARGPSRDWGITLPDLASRLTASAHVMLEPPDDALLTAVLEKLFADRQVRVPDTVVPYLVLRMERSLAAANRIVDALDTMALARGKPISRAMAAELLHRA